MRAITKLSEPLSLKRYRSVPGAYFDGYTNKAELRRQLLKEQCNLCCFCGISIPPFDELKGELPKMKIAHWKPITKYPEHQLQYGNMLAACMGNEGMPGKFHHCDTAQGNSELSKNPANPADNVEEIIRFSLDGIVTSTHTKFNLELGNPKRPDVADTYNRGVLNLNLRDLRNARKGVYDVFFERQKKEMRTGTRSTSYWTKKLQQYSGELGGNLESYAPILAYYIRRKIAKGLR